VEVYRTDVKAGLFILIGICLFLYSLFRVGGLMEAWEPGTHVTLVFTDAQQVEPGAEVYLRGLRVGRIKTLELNERGDAIHMLCKLEEDVALLAGTTARVTDKSMLGGKIVELLLPSDDKAKPKALPKDEPIMGIGPSGFNVTLDLVNSMVLEYKGQLDSLLVKANGLMDSLNTLSQTANTGVESFGTLKTDLKGTMASYNQLAKSLEAQVASLVEQANKVLETTRGSVTGMETEIATLTKSLDGQLKEVTTRLNTLLENSQTLVGQGNTVLAENRESLKASMETLTRTLNHLESFSAQVDERPSSLIWKGRK